MKNVGQFNDEKNAPVKGILYGTKISDCGIYITNRGLSYINSRVKNKEALLKKNESKVNDTIINGVYDIERTDITLEGAHLRPEMVEEVPNGEDKITYNYYTPFSTNNQRLHTLKEILLKDVYPGIDWLIQLIKDASGNTCLKYNFIVNRGGDLTDITLKYSKNVQLSLNEKGDLIASTVLGKFIEKAPVSYTKEGHRDLQFKYDLKGQLVKFKGDKVHFDEPVVIDPEVFWATYFPSLQPDVMYQSIVGGDVATDANSNIFITLTAAKKIPFITANPGNGAFYQDFSATAHGAIIIMKFTKNGNLLWSTYFSGKGQCAANVMTIDKGGNVLVTGQVKYDYIVDNSINYSDIPLKDNGGYFDAKAKENFITKFTNDGTLLWSSFFGGYSTYPQDITTDTQGNVYITGWSEWSDLPSIDPGNGAYMERQPHAAQLVFINQFDANNKLLWSTRMVGNDFDPDSRIEVDKKGNIYLGSNLRSTVYPWKDAGGYYVANAFGFSITKFNKDRQITWCTSVPGPFAFSDLTTDDDDNLYVASRPGVLRKFNEKTELVWTKTYPSQRSFYYDRMIYDKKNKVIQILGVMNDLTYDFPTKNTDCNGSFFYNGKGGKFGGVTNPMFFTYTTDGDLQYASLSDWPYEYYQNSNFAVDANGDLVYLFKDSRNGISNPALTDPGAGAYYHPEQNKQGQTPFFMKLTASELNVASTVKTSGSCNCNNT